jgi:hypothetical protein
VGRAYGGLESPHAEAGVVTVGVSGSVPPRRGVDTESRYYIGALELPAEIDRLKVSIAKARSGILAKSGSI